MLTSTSELASPALAASAGSSRTRSVQFAVAADGNLSGHGGASGVFSGGLSGVAFTEFGRALVVHARLVLGHPVAALGAVLQSHFAGQPNVAQVRQLGLTGAVDLCGAQDRGAVEEASLAQAHVGQQVAVALAVARAEVGDAAAQSAGFAPAAARPCRSRG